MHHINFLWTQVVLAELLQGEGDCELKEAAGSGEQSIADLTAKYRDLIKSKEASFAKMMAELLPKNAELVSQNTLLLKKFEDQAQVLKHTNEELAKAKQLASSLRTGKDSSGMAMGIEKLWLKNSVIGLSLRTTRRHMNLWKRSTIFC